MHISHNLKRYKIYKCWNLSKSFDTKVFQNKPIARRKTTYILDGSANGFFVTSKTKYNVFTWFLLWQALVCYMCNKHHTYTIHMILTYIRLTLLYRCAQNSTLYNVHTVITRKLWNRKSSFKGSVREKWKGV